MLKKINLKNIKNINNNQGILLAKEIRNLLFEIAKKYKIHFSSNLGIVETTIALHKVFNVPKDKVFFDVGHQSLVHKILTGRCKDINTFYSEYSKTPFQNPKDSIYDVYSGGHAGNAISIALGFALCKDNQWVVPVIGDGSITNGLAFEALNDIVNYQKEVTDKLIIVLNDNEMTISSTNGSITKTFKNKNKTLKFFNNLNLKYINIANGHDISAIEKGLKKAKKIKGPVVVHIKTIKGKGYDASEKDIVGAFHSSFFTQTNKTCNYIANWLFQQAIINNKIHVINPAMTFNTGYSNFETVIKNQYHNVGISEEHSLSLASGMALSGLKPYVHIYSSFLQRSYDQLVHDINRLNCSLTILIDRAGSKISDGSTHYGIYDVAFINTLNNFELMSPSNNEELQWMLNYSLNCNHPLAIRFENVVLPSKINHNKSINHGKWLKVIDNKNKKIIITYGDNVNIWFKKINEEKLDYDLVNALFIKPIDLDFIKNELSKYKDFKVVEDVIENNGLYDQIIKSLYEYESKKYF